MKKIIAALLALASAAAFSATLTPIQLLNPAGSTSGQAVVSTGASSAPAWGNPIAAYAAQAANTVLANVTASSASPTAVAIPSCSTATSAIQYTSGTGFSCGTEFAALTGATFTGPTGVSYSNSAFTLNDSSGSAKAQVIFSNAGAIAWTWDNVSASANKFALDRYVSGSYVDSPLSVSNSTGAVTMSDGITNTPISGSTGSFTTLAASSTVSGTGFSNYLASPPTIGGTTPGAVNANGGTLNAVTIGTTSAGAAQFSQLVMTGLLTPQSTTGIKGTPTNDSPAAGSVGENPTNSNTLVSMTANTPANCTSEPLTAGNWLVWGNVVFTPAGSTTVAQIIAGVSTTSSTLPAVGSYAGLQLSFTTGGGQQMAAPPQTLKLASTTTVYLVGQANFAASTMTCNGYINAIRIR